MTTSWSTRFWSSAAALLCRTSSPPNACTVSATIAATASASATSATCTRAVPPAAAIVVDDTGGRGLRDVGDRDARAFGREQQRGRAPDARSAARDDRDLVREPAHDDLPPHCVGGRSRVSRDVVVGVSPCPRPRSRPAGAAIVIGEPMSEKVTEYVPFVVTGLGGAASRGPGMIVMWSLVFTSWSPGWAHCFTPSWTKHAGAGISVWLVVSARRCTVSSLATQSSRLVMSLPSTEPSVTWSVGSALRFVARM